MICLRYCGCAALLVAVLAGCSNSEAVGFVEGNVTLNMQPLEQGLIRFVPTDGKTQPADGPIAAGKYSVKVPVGEVRVEITSPKVVGQMQMYPDSPPVDRVAEAIPARYNTKTTEKMTITKAKSAKDKLEKNFELTSP
ncbi:hypothetical protein [Anatilimnocola floriformis]|uniref:hypothetical protein n=1 Tax=Anatilimnocola floriformis TaxID=2948575 RepID=UPI0020C454F0|nr:hypothetical protein [Anatilimnocola floriformis]